MKVALDTNVLANAEGANGAAKRDRALEVIQRLPVGAVVLPVQALGELFNVLVRKAKAAAGTRAGSRAELAGCLSDG
jgi:predicted nucleic acid-binding protein